MKQQYTNCIVDEEQLKLEQWEPLRDAVRNLTIANLGLDLQDIVIDGGVKLVLDTVSTLFPHNEKRLQHLLSKEYQTLHLKVLHSDEFFCGIYEVRVSALTVLIGYVGNRIVYVSDNLYGLRLKPMASPLWMPIYPTYDGNIARERLRLRYSEGLCRNRTIPFDRLFDGGGFSVETNFRFEIVGIAFDDSNIGEVDTAHREQLAQQFYGWAALSLVNNFDKTTWIFSLLLSPNGQIYDLGHERNENIWFTVGRRIELSEVKRLAQKALQKVRTKK